VCCTSVRDSQYSVRTRMPLIFHRCLGTKSCVHVICTWYSCYARRKHMLRLSMADMKKMAMPACSLTRRVRNAYMCKHTDFLHNWCLLLINDDVYILFRFRDTIRVLRCMMMRPCRCEEVVPHLQHLLILQYIMMYNASLRTRTLWRNSPVALATARG
jgi:hypothetical protein